MSQLSNTEVNPTIVLVIAIFTLLGTPWFVVTGPLLSFIALYVVVKTSDARSLGSLLWSYIPILSFIIVLDAWMVSKKLKAGETLDEFHHEIQFLEKLPLLHKKQDIAVNSA